jgi:hypothetical protein
MIVCDSRDLLEFFGCEPRVSNEYGAEASYSYTDSRHELEFGYNADTSDCSIVVTPLGADRPVVSFVYLNCPGARIVNDKRGECLEVAAPGAASGASLETFLPTRGLRIWLRPAITVEGFGDA